MEKLNYYWERFEGNEWRILKRSDKPETMKRNLISKYSGSKKFNEKTDRIRIKKTIKIVTEHIISPQELLNNL